MTATVQPASGNPGPSRLCQECLPTTNTELLDSVVHHRSGSDTARTMEAACNELSRESILKWLTGSREGSWVGFLVRSVMENGTSYDQALDTLTTTLLLAPAYFILGAAASSRLTYTTLMEVSTGRIESYIRDCPDPCPLW
ncbi:hypothetical protein ACOMHN_053676 [Nucella lapillus]